MNALWLMALLVAPLLTVLLVLMDWLEKHLAGRLIADDIAVVLDSITTLDELEAAISERTAPLFEGLVRS